MEYTFTITKQEESWLNKVRKIVKKHYHLLPKDEDGLVVDELGGLINQYDWLTIKGIIKSKHKKSNRIFKSKLNPHE